MRPGHGRATGVILVAALLGTVVPHPATADDAPRVRAVRFDGVPRGRLTALRARVSDLVDAPATEDRLIDAVRRLEVERWLGGLDVHLRAVRGGDLVDVVFEADGRPRRLAALRLTTRPRGEADSDESWRLARQIQARLGTFASGEGRRFHPYLLRLDAERARRYFQRRGHRHAEVRIELRDDAELVTATLRITPGPRYTVSAVRIEGVDHGREEVLAALATRADDDTPLVDAMLEADAERIRAFYCRRGFPDAAVETETSAPRDQRVDVTFRVRPGPPARVQSLRLRGAPLPASLIRELPVQPDDPFCPDRVRDAEALVAAFLREHGHPDAAIESRVVRVPPAGDARPQGARVEIDVRAGGQVRVERIWFEGDPVTRVSVIRQLLAIEEGDVLRQSAVEQSVQSLRRSGLFKSASVQTLRGSHPATRYLLFTLEPAEQVSIDLAEQTLTFRNLDLTDWPESLDALGEGQGLRGRGHVLRFNGQLDWQGVQFVDRYLHRHVLARVEAHRRLRELGPVDETWYTIEGGIGLKALENRVSLLPVFQLEMTTVPERQAFAGLPIARGDVFTTALGVEGRVDLNLRDAERIPYLGFGVEVRTLFGLPALGSELGWRAVVAESTLHVPLGTNHRDQHYVLKLAATFAHVDPDEPDALTPHLRPLPTIRGFERRTIGLTFEIPGGEEVTLGGTTVTTASAELRVPVPIGRRNAVAPFFDAATVAGDDDPVLAHPHLAAGAAVYVSLFSERLEGFVFVASPLTEEDAEPEYVGAGVGGSF